MTNDPDHLIADFADLVRNRTDQELLDICYASPAAHFACFCKIRDKNNVIISPTPNILQLRMSEAYETMRRMEVKVRIIVTKPRRAGCSTFAAHILYHHGMKVPCEGIAIADKKEHSEALLKKLKSYQGADSYPWEVQMIADPLHSIEWSNGTKWNVDTAQNPNASVGDTNQLGLFSETSKWPQTTQRNDKVVMAAVLPTLSGSDSVAFSESTPEGAVGWQYSTWQVAVTLEEFIRMFEAGIRPEEQWVKIFAGWWEFGDNRRKQPVSAQEIAHIQATLDDTERDEIVKYGLDWEQVAWRRDTIKSVCNGDPKVFSYYYPSDDVSCWLASGSPRFDMGILVEMENRARLITPDTGYLLTQDSGQVTWQNTRDGTGDILVWEHPIEHCRYLVTIDPATDASQTIGADPDRHSVSVWRDGYHDADFDRWRPAMKVARLRPPFYGEGDEVAGHAARLSRFYGTCMTVIEINCGLDILRLLKDNGIPCHKRRPDSHRTGQIVEQYGFKMTDKQERNAVIEGFAAAIRDRAIDVLCLHSIQEYKTFIVRPNGRAEAAGGAHDDDCFIRGTMILTPSGQVPIETLKVGNMVITRDGPKPIARTFARIKPVISNLGLVGTATHPIITPDGEKRLSMVSASNTLYIWNTTTNRPEKLSFTEAKNTIGIHSHNEDNSVFIFGDMINGRHHLLHFIGKSGLTIMGKFQSATSFITRMATRSIMTLGIWKQSLLAPTPECTCGILHKNDSCVKPDTDKLNASSQRSKNGEAFQNQKQPCGKSHANPYSLQNVNWRAFAVGLFFYPPIGVLSFVLKVVELGLSLIHI